jgi:predicted AAA+ superfamily ATPase
MEVVKTLTNRGMDPHVYFWRTSTGVEVDLVVDVGATLIPIETKLSATPRPAMADGILKFRRDIGKAVAPGYAIHPGQVTLPLAPGVTALPFAAL